MDRISSHKAAIGAVQAHGLANHHRANQAARRGQEIQPRLILRRLGSPVLKCFMHEVELNSIKAFYESRYSQQYYQIVLDRLTSLV